MNDELDHESLARRISLFELFDKALQKHFFQTLLVYPLTFSGWLFSAFVYLGWQPASYTFFVFLFVYYIIVTSRIWINWKTQERLMLVVKDQIAVLSEKLNDSEDLARRIGTKFASHIRSLPDYYSIKAWHEEIHVHEHGDTEVIRTITLRAGRDGIDMSYQNLFANEPSQESDVAICAFMIALDDQGVPLVGVDGREILTELACFTVWQERGTNVSTFLVLDEHYEPDSLVAIRITWSWKGYCRRLLEIGNDLHRISMSRACDEFTIRIVLDKVAAFASGNILAKPIRSLNGEKYVTSEVTMKPAGTNTCEVNFRATNLKREDRVGFSIKAPK